MSVEEAQSTASKGQGAAAGADGSAAATAPAADDDAAAADENAESDCPICKFMQAGPCGEGHKEWQACRVEAKRDGVDFVQHCSQTFRTFFGCMLDHQDYYQPFLEAFHVDINKSQEAIDKGRGQEQQDTQRQQDHHHQQQQQQRQPDTGMMQTSSRR